MSNWQPALPDTGTPLYLAIADMIEDDIRTGALTPGDRLPSQRSLSAQLGIDFTTVSRGYSEARRRNLISSEVGRGTFVRKNTTELPLTQAAPDPLRTGQVDLRYNMPPEPEDPILLRRMQDGLRAVSANLVALLRYQDASLSEADRAAASSWLSKRGLAPTQNRIFLSPGTHPALGVIMRLLCGSGDTILCEAITYPGIKAVAKMHNVALAGIPMDEHGILPDALEQMIKQHSPKALYLNPTLQNPTTITIPEARRREIADLLVKYGLPLIEDDAYGFVAPEAPAPFAATIPHLTWHLAGLSKCLGAGLRLAYVITPDVGVGFNFRDGLHGMTIMPSPLTTALATHWIMDGTADEIRRFTRSECQLRQEEAATILKDFEFRSDPYAFNLWINVPNLQSRISKLSFFAAAGLGVTSSEVFHVGKEGASIDHVRLCIGGKLSREQLTSSLQTFAHMMGESDMHLG